MHIAPFWSDVDFSRASFMKACASYVLPVSCLLLMAGYGGWYFYSKINVLLDVTHLDKSESMPSQIVSAAQYKPAIDPNVGGLKDLFGNPKSALPKKIVKEKEKPELAIVLHGVFTGAGERKAAAVISSNGGKQRIYYAGDSVTDELELVSVQEKEVLIKDANGLRSMRLEQKLDGDKAFSAPVDPLVQDSLRKEIVTNQAAPEYNPLTKGGGSPDKDVSGKLSRLKSLAHEERK